MTGAHEEQKIPSGMMAARLLNELSKYTTIPKEGTTYSTHGIHPYPAKFIPQIPARIIEECSNERHTILDPFCGSGTTLLEARLRGRDSIGFDVNPIAVLISRVKTTTLSKEDWEEVDAVVSRIMSKFERKEYSEVWIPNIPRIEHWFRKDVCMDLGLIAGELQKLETSSVKNFLEAAFSSIIVQVSNQESETRFAAIEKNLPPNVVRNSFARKIRTMSERVNSLVFVPDVERSTTKVFAADARKLTDYIPSHSIDLVVTSPPYLNAYEYYLYHKFRIYWLGFDNEVFPVDRVREMEIGSRFQYSGKNGESVDEFRKQMMDCFAELEKVTKLGKLVFVLVGDSIVRNEFMEMDKFYEEICENLGFQFVAKTSYPLNDITRSFRARASGSRKDFRKSQHILVFQNRSNNTSSRIINERTYSKPDLVVEQIPRHVTSGTTLLISNNNVSEYTHAIVKYPSKFIPDIPRWAIDNHSTKGDLILDPFVGCGTTMVEARLLSRNCIGLDINPFAVLASNVKANPIDGETLENGLHRILNVIAKIGSVSLPKFPLRDFWFDRNALTKLIKIRSAILAEEDSSVKDFFLLVLGSIIKPCSYLDESQIKVERDQRKLLEGVPDPIHLFGKKAMSHINAMREFCRDASPNTFTFACNCDSTIIPDSLIWRNRIYPTEQFDLVVTSPPYINAINYPMFNRYELLLLGLIDYKEYISHQRSYLGTERVYASEYSKIDDFSLGSKSFKELNQRLRKIYELEPKRGYIVRRYFDGMAKSIREIHRLLKRKGKFILVTGSNTIKGVPIQTFDILRQCAEEIGFSTLNVFSYQIRNHRFKITRHETGKQINVDNIVVMEKI